MNERKISRSVEGVAGDAAGVALGAGALYMLAKMWLKPKPPTVTIEQPSGEVIEVPLIPEDYHDQQWYIDQGLVTPPTKVTYEQNLINQPMEMEGYTWMSGDVNEERARELEAEAAAAAAEAEAAAQDAAEQAAIRRAEERAARAQAEREAAAAAEAARRAAQAAQAAAVAAAAQREKERVAALTQQQQSEYYAGYDAAEMRRK